MRLGDVIKIRPLALDDASVIAQVFTAIGWNKPVEQYVRYVEEQNAGVRECWLANVDAGFAGYVTLKWNSSYAALAGPTARAVQPQDVLRTSDRRH